MRLVEVDLAADLGFDVPGAAAATGRAPCGACGLSKRHLFNATALEGGYDVVATGHNLDDEAAVLLGNVLRWDTGYLGRQHPVLPAAPGFVRKVKPLVRLGERESAAYCVLRGIDYQVEECPMAAGNRHLGYKEMLNDLEARSPGTKAAFLFGFIERGHERFADTAEEERAALGTCSSCGAPTPVRPFGHGAGSPFGHGAGIRSPGVRVLPSPRTRVRREPAGRAARPAAAAGEAVAVARLFAAGDRVLLVDTKRRRHLVTLVEGGQFHTHNGVLEHDAIIGHEEGIAARTTLGSRLTAVRPTLGEYVLEMPRGAQVIYPKDLGPILVLADIFPGARVLESGVGSGALTLALLARGRRGWARHRLRDPRRLRRAAPAPMSTASSDPTCPSTSTCATSTPESTPTPGASTGSSSTFPSRGGS